jgi:hypothetical protein
LDFRRLRRILGSGMFTESLWIFTAAATEQIYCERCGVFTTHQLRTADGSPTPVCVPCLEDLILAQALDEAMEGSSAKKDEEQKPRRIPNPAISCSLPS